MNRSSSAEPTLRTPGVGFPHSFVEDRILLLCTDTGSDDYCLHGPEEERNGNINFEADNRACVNCSTVVPNGYNNDCNAAVLQANNWFTCGSTDVLSTCIDFSPHVLPVLHITSRRTSVWCPSRGA